MRAGVLSDDQNIEFLNKNFINTWVPNSELGRIPSLRDPIAKRREREGKTFDTSHPLAQKIMTGWNERSPVDCLVLSSELELIGNLPINDFFITKLEGLGDEEAYLIFLKAALTGKKPGLDDSTSGPQSTDWNFFFNNRITHDNGDKQ